MWTTPRSQTPDFLSTTEDTARSEVASLPNPAAGDDDGYMPASFILTVNHVLDDVDQGTKCSPPCGVAGPPAGTVDRVEHDQEFRFDEDFDGDSEVASPGT